MTSPSLLEAHATAETIETADMIRNNTEIPSVELMDVSVANQCSSSDDIFAEALVTNDDDSLPDMSLAVAEMVSHSYAPDFACSYAVEEESSELQRRAEYISATIFKEDKTKALGIGMKLIDKRLTISSKMKGGLLYYSPIRVGDILISINHTWCKGMDEKTASQFLSSLDGSITLVVHNVGGDPTLVESMITKLNPNDVAGIGLTGGSIYNGSDMPEITSIASDGLFSSSLLNLGDRVVTVNNVSCENLDNRATANLIKYAPSTVTVVAENYSGTASVVGASPVPAKRPGCLFATIHRQRSETPLGIDFKVVREGFKTVLVISSIKEGLIKDYTPFKVGDTMVSINNRKLVNISQKVIGKILKSLTGNITFVASTPAGDETLLGITAMKKSRDHRMGITLKRKTDEDDKSSIVVSSIHSSSFFASSLQVGDELLSINDVTCDDLDAQTAASIIRNARKQVKFVAKTSKPVSNSRPLRQRTRTM